jgi:CheY-like chemotaxis protein
LIIDDSEDNRLLVRCFLKDQVLKIGEAENGEEGLEKYKSKKYDAILMDISMPVLDGYEATKEIRKLEKEKGIDPIPIIAFTASSFSEEVKKCLDVGCTTHLAKPVRKTNFLAALAELDNQLRLQYQKAA